MFYLVHSILTDEKKKTPNFTTFFSSFIAGYFYALSPLIFSEFIGGAITQFLAYSLIPASLFFCRKMKFNGDFRYIFAFTIILSLISVSFNALPLVLLIIALYAIFLGNKQMAKGLIISFLIYLPFNLYWIVPTLSEMTQGASSLSLSLPNALYLPNLFNAVPSMSQIFVGLGYARPFSMWILEETILPIWAIVTFSFLICILICLLLFHKTKENFFWLALYTVSLAIVTVGNSPISGAMLWLYKNVSLMSLYRSPQHLIILTILPLAILVGIGSFAIISLSKKRIKKLVNIGSRKMLTIAVFTLIFLSATIWISPFLTGNLGADYLKPKGGGNFVDTFILSPDLVTALGIINNGSDSYRTLFLPPTNSPYYLETPYQQEGQGGDVVIGCTQQGIGDGSNPYTNQLVSAISNSFENGTFDNPQLLQIANIKYVVLRNDVKPNFGLYANMWNFNRTLSNLEQIDGLKLIYVGPHVSLWEYENYDPLIYAVKNLTTASIQEAALIFTPAAELTYSTILSDFENYSELTNWFTSKNFEQNLTLDSSIFIHGNSSLQLTYNKSYGEGGGNLNYIITNAENLSEYNFVSVWLYYPTVPTSNTHVLLYLYNSSWNTLEEDESSVTQAGWNNLLFSINAKNLCNASILRFQFYDSSFANETTKINFDDIELRSYSQREAIIIHNDTPPVPTIHFQEVDSSTYKVSVVNATQPFYLIFSETYNPSWQVYEGSVNWLDILTNKPFPAEHLLINTYANAWYINKTGAFTVTLHYSPQNTFYLSSIVSVLTFTGCIAVTIYSYTKLTRQKSKQKTIPNN